MTAKNSAVGNCQSLGPANTYCKQASFFLWGCDLIKHPRNLRKKTFSKGNERPYVGYLTLLVYSRLWEARASYMAFVWGFQLHQTSSLPGRVEFLTCQISCWLHARSKEMSSPFADPVDQGYCILENKFWYGFQHHTLDFMTEAESKTLNYFKQLFQ